MSEEKKKLHLLVTGATGFVGSRLIERMADDNRFLSILATGRNEQIGKKLASQKVDFQPGDLTDPKFVNTITKNRDVIVHCAALAAPWGNYQEFHNANVVTTQNLINACKINKVKRIVYLSTPSIYQTHHVDQVNISELDILPKKMINHYAATKLVAEELLKDAFHRGLETVILRPRAIIGRGDTNILPRIIDAQKAGSLFIIGDGKNKVDLTSVSNVVDAIDLSIFAPKQALGHAFNITNDAPIAMWEMIEEIFNQLNLRLSQRKVPYFVAFNIARLQEWVATITRSQQEPKLTRYSVGVLSKSMTLNIHKAKNLLGYRPRQSNLEAIEEFVSWWKEKHPIK
ncbi:MAG: NAD-dependent epimerase/dehydratase family protein [Chitinophagales bacterium]